MLEKLQGIDLLGVQRERSRRSLAYFAKKAWPVVEPGYVYTHGWHIDAICEHLQAATDGEIRNLLINIPPRHMKSLLVSVFWPAWVWTFRPDTRWLFASYAESLSIRDSVKCRRLIQSDWYRILYGESFELTGDQNEKKKFENNKTGYRMATSVEGSGTGEGGDFVVCDDPHNVTEADSPANRNGVLNWWDGAMSTRGNNPKRWVKVVVMQRVHQADLSGHILEQGGYDHLCLPAEYEGGEKKFTSIGWSDPRTEVGELLWPERFGKPEIDEIKKRMLPKDQAGQLQQRPSPEKGLIVDRAWWKFHNLSKEDSTAMGNQCISADLTFKDGEKNDFAVFTVWSRRGSEKFLLDMVRARMSFTDSLAIMRNLTEKWPYASAKYVEEAANGAALIDTLKKTISGIIPIRPRGSKVARAEAIAPQIMAGNVYLPDKVANPWVLDIIEEWAFFPNGKNDDIVDSMSQALLKLEEKTILGVSPISMTSASKWRI